MTQAANRGFTFGVRGGMAIRHHAEGLAVFALALAPTSGPLAATALRFTLLRGWVFHPAVAEPHPVPKGSFR